MPKFYKIGTRTTLRYFKVCGTKENEPESIKKSDLIAVDNLFVNCTTTSGQIKSATIDKNKSFYSPEKLEVMVKLATSISEEEYQAFCDIANAKLDEVNAMFKNFSFGVKKMN